MANEFVARNGLIALDSSQITGSLSVSNNVIASSFTGSLLGTATSASFALTASSADNFNVRNTLTATTLVVQTITSSQEFVTGSTKFGSINSNTHEFTGSVSISGSSVFGLDVNNGTLYVSASGNVGIGTTTIGSRLQVNGNVAIGYSAFTAAPTNGLQVAGSITGASNSNTFGTSSASGYPVIVNTGTGANSIKINGRNNAPNDESAIEFFRFDGVTRVAFIQAATNFFAFATSTEAMRISSSGNVGIGTTSPSDRLVVNGNLFLSGSSRSVWIGNNADSQPRFRMHHNGTDAYLDYSSSLYIRSGDASIRTTFTPAGSVGIGTTAPSYLFHAVTGSELTNPEINIGVFYGFFNSSATLNTGVGILFGSNNNPGVALISQRTGANNEHALRIQTRNNAGNGATRMVVLGDGNVGIGTITPTALLNVSSSTASSLLRIDSAAGAGTLFVSSSGRVGIGTTNPTTRLFVSNAANGNIVFVTNTVDADLAINLTSGVTLLSPTTTILSLGTSNTERMRISGSNVGIGTTAPSARLDVSGSTVISGSLTVVTGSSIELQVTNTGVNIGNLITDTHNLTGSLNISGSLSISSSLLTYRQNLSIATGSFQTIVSIATGSYRCAFFDYVTFSGSVVRAGTVTTTWSGSTTEFYENFTEDLGGSTSVVTLQTAISGSNIELQAGISGSAWAVRSLVRLL
jgi:hypothetical protein